MKDNCINCIYSRDRQDFSGLVCIRDIKDIRDIKCNDCCGYYDDKLKSDWSKLENKGLDTPLKKW